MSLTYFPPQLPEIKQQHILLHRPPSQTSFAQKPREIHTTAVMIGLHHRFQLGFLTFCSAWWPPKVQSPSLQRVLWLLMPLCMLLIPLLCCSLPAGIDRKQQHCSMLVLNTWKEHHSTVVAHLSSSSFKKTKKDKTTTLPLAFSVSR